LYIEKIKKNIVFYKKLQISFKIKAFFNHFTNKFLLKPLKKPLKSAIYKFPCHIKPFMIYFRYQTKGDRYDEGKT